MMPMRQRLPPAPEIRYQDYFENLTEMIAMLSAEGKYLYVNSAWQRYFGRDAVSARTLEGFASAFPFAIQSQAAAIFSGLWPASALSRCTCAWKTPPNCREMEAHLRVARSGTTACCALHSARRYASQPARAAPGHAIGSRPGSAGSIDGGLITADPLCPGQPSWLRSR